MRACLLAATAEALADQSAGRRRLRDINVIEIVNRAGTSRTNFYRHFRDVEHALLELGKEPMRDFVAIVEQHPLGAGAVEHCEVRDWLLAVLELQEHHHALLRSLQLAAEANPGGPLSLQWEDWRSQLRGAVRSWIEDARSASASNDSFPAGDLAEAVAEAGDALRRRWVRKHPQGLSAEHLAEVADLATQVSLRLIIPTSH